MEDCVSDASSRMNGTHSVFCGDSEHLWDLRVIEAIKVEREIDYIRRELLESFEFLRGLLSDCRSKITGLVPSLDEIGNYVRPLKRQVEEFIKHKKLLKAGNKQLNDEITMLKEIIGVRGYQIRHLSVSLQVETDRHGTNSEAVNKIVSTELSASHPISNGDAAIIDFLMKLDADEVSTVEFSDFTGLDGERKKVGKYSVPPSLVPTAENIIAVYGDVSASCNMNPRVAESVYIMFCASIKEMSDLRLEQVTEDLILKWRDAIKDASRVSFNVAFAMEHLKKIARAYIGLTEFLKLEDVAFRIFDSDSESSAATEEINDKPVSPGEMLRRLKQDLLAMEAVKKKLVDDIMVFVEAIGKNDIEKAQNFDEKTMKDTILTLRNTILTLMNSNRGVVDNMGNT